MGRIDVRKLWFIRVKAPVRPLSPRSNSTGGAIQHAAVGQERQAHDTVSAGQTQRDGLARRMLPTQFAVGDFDLGPMALATRNRRPMEPSRSAAS